MKSSVKLRIIFAMEREDTISGLAGVFWDLNTSRIFQRETRFQKMREKSIERVRSVPVILIVQAPMVGMFFCQMVYQPARIDRVENATRTLILKAIEGKYQDMKDNRSHSKAPKGIGTLSEASLYIKNRSQPNRKWRT